MLDGDDYLKATARTPVALVSEGTLGALGLVAGQRVTLHSSRGSVTLPVAAADLPDGVVWAPTTARFAGRSGSVVRLAGEAGSLEGAQA